MISALDFPRFGKIRALFERTNNRGEKQAAERMLGAMATRAGLTLEQALAADDARQRPRNPFRSLFDTAGQRRDRARRRAARKLIEEGLSDRGIAQRLGVPIAMVRAVRAVMP